MISLPPLSLIWLKEYAESKGGITITAQSRHLNDLKDLLQNMRTNRGLGSYTGLLSLGDLYDNFSDLASCSCDFVQGVGCTLILGVYVM